MYSKAKEVFEVGLLKTRFNNSLLKLKKVRCSRRKALRFKSGRPLDYPDIVPLDIRPIQC